MYQLYGLSLCLQAFGLGCVVVAIAVSLLFPPVDLRDAISLASMTVTSLGVLVWLLGETPVFAWLCRHKPVCWLFPDVDGRWGGTIQSNFDLRLAAGDPQSVVSTPALREVAVTATIRARFRSVSIEVNTGYMSSRTLHCGVARPQGPGSVELIYVFRCTVPKPETTDAATFEGAAILTLGHDGDGEPSLTGTQWTNRMWHVGRNTAGPITLKRRPSGATAPPLAAD